MWLGSSSLPFLKLTLTSSLPGYSAPTPIKPLKVKYQAYDYRYSVTGSPVDSVYGVAEHAVFTARRYATAVFAVAMSVCLYVTSWYCIETTGRIELVFGTEASFQLSHTVIRKFGHLQAPKLGYTFLWNFVSDSGL